MLVRWTGSGVLVLVLLLMLLLLLLMLSGMHYRSCGGGRASIQTRVGSRNVIRRLDHDRLRMMTLLLAMLMMLRKVNS